MDECYCAYAANRRVHLFYTVQTVILNACSELALKGRELVKKIDVEKDLNRSKFLITAMIAQVVLVLVAMFCYWIYLKL